MCGTTYAPLQSSNTLNYRRMITRAIASLHTYHRPLYHALSTVNGLSRSTELTKLRRAKEQARPILFENFRIGQSLSNRMKSNSNSNRISNLLVPTKIPWFRIRSTPLTVLLQLQSLGRLAGSWACLPFTPISTEPTSLWWWKTIFRNALRHLPPVVTLPTQLFLRLWMIYCTVALMRSTAFHGNHALSGTCIRSAMQGLTIATLRGPRFHTFMGPSLPPLLPLSPLPSSPLLFAIQSLSPPFPGCAH